MALRRVRDTVESVSDPQVPSLSRAPASSAVRNEHPHRPHAPIPGGAVHLSLASLCCALAGVLAEAVLHTHALVAVAIPVALELLAMSCGLAARRIGGGRATRLGSVGLRLACAVLAVDLLAVVVIPHLLGPASAPHLP